MSNLVISATLFAALIAVANAATYTTVVTTTTVVVEEEENLRGQSCKREIRQMVPMRNCMQWMQSMMGGGPYVSNPRYLLDEDHLQECCNEMRVVSTPCRCEAMKHVMTQMLQQQQHGTEEVMQQMMKLKMQSLPRTCSMRSPTLCRLQTVFV